MLHHDEVHVYPIIDTRTNKLITAIVGYETEHDFTANFDDVAAQVAGRTVNETSLTNTDPFTEVIQVTHDDKVDLALVVSQPYRRPLRPAAATSPYYSFVHSRWE